MAPERRSALLFEFKYHQEIIPAQVKFLLDDGWDVHLFLDTQLYDEALFACIKDRITINLFPNSRKWYVKLRLYFEFRRYVKENGISLLIVNTLDSTFGSFLIRSFPGIYKVGIAHRIHDIATSSGYRRNCELMQGVVTLSKHTYDFMIRNFPDLKNPTWFYPIFFCPPETGLRKPKKAISVAIPGQISVSRRDYFSVIEAARILKDKNLAIKFVLLGDARKFDGPEVVARINNAGLEDCFEIWQEFIPYKKFIDEMHHADFVMPLLSPDQDNSINYKNSQISAAINWALGFHKKILLHEYFRSLDFLAPNAVYYNSQNLNEVLCELNRSLSGPYVNIPELTFENIKSMYLKAIV